MQIVIEVDDDLYTRLFDNGIDNHDDAANMAKAIRKGKVLPKWHGRLIDCKELAVTPIDITDLPEDRCLMVYLAEDVDGATTILEAVNKEYEAKVITRGGNCMICGKELTEGLFLCKECGDKANIRK